MLKLYNRIKNMQGSSVSIARRLALYWICMALALLSAALFLLNVTGVVSRMPRQFGEMATQQQENTAALLTAQMDALTAKGVSLSRQISAELNDFLAHHSMDFEALNNNPDGIAELETQLMPQLQAALESSTCSGVYFCLDATANTALPEADHTRMGVYLRFSSLRSSHPSGTTAYYRGTVGAARQTGLLLHNRWNPELNIDNIPGYQQVMAWTGDRLSDGCLWTERIPLPDTWESVTLLCVPILDDMGTVRGVCGMELSALYFSLSHSSVPSPYGSFVSLLAPLDGNKLLLDKAMLGSTEGISLSNTGELKIKPGRFFDTFTQNGTSYLGKYQIVPGKLADGKPLVAVTMISETGFRRLATHVRISWMLGSLVFLISMLLIATALSRRFMRPITKGFEAMQSCGEGDEPMPLTGIRELDELAAYLQNRPQAALNEDDNLPVQMDNLLTSFITRADALTGTERTILQYYADGYAVKDIPDLLFISAGTVKGHNRNIYRKLEVSSYDELKAYLNIMERCGKIDALFEGKFHVPTL